MSKLSSTKITAAVLLLCLGTAGAQEILRPTADADNSGAPCTATTIVASTAMTNAYDASGTATSSALPAASGISCISGHPTLCKSRRTGRVFTTWASASGIYTSLNLNFNSSCATGGTDPTLAECSLQYSLDGGSTWVAVHSTQNGWSQVTDTVTLTTSQNLSQIQVRACGQGFGSVGSASSAGGAGTATLTIFDIWTAGVLLPPPATPTNLSVTPAANGLSNALAWTDNAGSNATSYQINKCSGVSCTPTTYSTGLASGSTAFTDSSGVSPGTIYGYQACAINAAGTSCSTTTFATTPSAPSAPSALAMSFSNTSITASWTNNAGNATNNILQKCQGSGCTPVDYQTLAPSTTTFTDTAVTQKSSYTYNVVASNAVGRSAGAGNKTIVSLGHQDGHTNHKIAQ